MFTRLLDSIKPSLQHQDTQLRMAISPDKRNLFPIPEIVVEIKAPVNKVLPEFPKACYMAQMLKCSPKLNAIHRYYRINLSVYGSCYQLRKFGLGSI